MEKNSREYSFSGLCTAIEQGTLHVSVHLAAYDGPDISSRVTPFTGHLSPVSLPHCADLPFFIRVFSQCDYQSWLCNLNSQAANCSNYMDVVILHIHKDTVSVYLWQSTCTFLFFSYLLEYSKDNEQNPRKHVNLVKFQPNEWQGPPPCIRPLIWEEAPWNQFLGQSDQ